METEQTTTQVERSWLSYLPVLVSLLVTLPIIWAGAGLGVSLGGESVSFFWISWTLSAIVAIAVPLLLRRFRVLYWLSPLFSLVLAVLLMFGTSYGLKPFEESLRTERALREVPVFPGAELKEVTYFHPDGSEPTVSLEFALPNAKERYCEVAAYYDTELRNAGWPKSKPIPGFDPLKYSPVECSENELYFKKYPHRFITVGYPGFDYEVYRMAKKDTYIVTMKF